MHYSSITTECTKQRLRLTKRVLGRMLSHDRGRRMRHDLRDAHRIAARDIETGDRKRDHEIVAVE